MALTVLCGVSVPGAAQQASDTTFLPPIIRPAFQLGAGPTVVIDAANLNFHTAEGGYLAFARLLRRDGYQVRSNDKPFTAASLEGTDTLVIVNAMHRQSEEA